jgi:hypothetical protein
MKFVLLLLVIGAGLFFFTGGFDAFGDKCADDYIQQQVSKIYENLDTNPMHDELMRQMNYAVEQGVLPLSKRDEAIRTNLEVAVRRRFNCEIPPELNERLTSVYASNPGGQECPAGQYSAEAQQQYNELRANANYEALETQFYNQLIAQFKAERMRPKFDAKWEDESFRSRMIISALNTQLRQMNNCQNPALPMAPIFQEMAD